MLRAGVVKFCSEHNTDLVPSTCVACRAVSRMVKPAMLEQLIRIGSTELAQPTHFPTAANCFAVRLNMKPPSLNFEESDMSLATSVFSRGKMTPVAMFDDLTRKYLFLSQDQNEVLTKAVRVEQMLMKYKRDKNHAYIF